MRSRVLALALLLTACTSTPTGDAEYLLSEGVIDGPNSLTRAGAATIEVSNIGEFSHTLVVTDAEGGVVGATDLIEPGAAATLAVDLEPGTYVFSCRIVSEDSEGNLIDHFEAGMHRTVKVRG